MLTRNFNPLLGWTVWLNQRFTSGLDKSGAVDRGGLLSIGGQSQVIAPDNPMRSGFFIQNQSIADLWINDTGPAAVGAPSIRVPAGSTFAFPPEGAPLTAISLFGLSTGQAFTAREW